MRPVIHHSTDADDAGAGGDRESRDNRLCLRNGLRRRREDFIDDRNLRRMDGHLADEAVAGRLLAFAAETGVVAEIDEHRVDCGDARGRRAGKTQGARKAIRIEKPPIRVAICMRAELGGEILGAPGQPDQSLACASKAAAVSVAIGKILMWPSGRSFLASRTASLASA